MTKLQELIIDINARDSASENGCKFHHHEVMAIANEAEKEIANRQDKLTRILTQMNNYQNGLITAKEAMENITIVLIEN